MYNEIQLSLEKERNLKHITIGMDLEDTMLSEIGEVVKKGK